jgi:2-hydroxy-5-methyl-1-naphthoate 7-hydroxylase
MSDAPPAAGRTAEQPIGLDVERKYIQGEGARLRNCKPAARVELPERVPAGAIGNYSLARQLADPRVSRNARLHWSAWKLGEIPKNWPLRPSAEIEHMGTGQER